MNTFKVHGRKYCTWPGFSKTAVLHPDAYHRQFYQKCPVCGKEFPGRLFFDHMLIHVRRYEAVEFLESDGSPLDFQGQRYWPKIVRYRIPTDTERAALMAMPRVRFIDWGLTDLSLLAH